MEIEELVLHAYDELTKIDGENEEERFQQAIDRSNNLLDLLTSNKHEAKKHINYPLIQPELEKIEGEVRTAHRTAKAREYLAYGAQLIRTNPFTAIIHLGNDLITKGLLDLEEQRKRMQEEADKVWRSDELANHKSPEEQHDNVQYSHSAV
ncbi:MAG: hypothetical protein AABY16_00350 [Nanoarchaeota archaeon]